MSTSALQRFDPNFEALLREAAAAPRSLLLRVERPQIFPALRSREAPVSVAMAGLSNVERELLASYRCELGFLLRQAALTALMTDSVSGPWIDLTFAGRQMHQLPSTSDWTDQVEHLPVPEAAHTADDTSVALQAVDQLICRGLRSATVPEISAASMRVEMADQARVYVGAHFAARGETTKSIGVLRSVLQGPSSAECAEFAHENIALAFGRAGEFGSAINSTQLALATGYDRPETSLRLLLYSLLAGHDGAIRRAMVCVSQNVRQDDPSIDAVCADISWQLRGGFWFLSSTVKSAIAVARDQADPVSTRILDDLTA